MSLTLALQQDPTVDLKLDLKCLLKAAVPVGSECSCSASPDVVLVQGDDGDTAAGREDAGLLEDEETLSQGTVSLLNISTSDNEEAHKVTAHETACAGATFSMVPGGMNRSARGMKALPSVTHR